MDFNKESFDYDLNPVAKSLCTFKIEKKCSSLDLLLKYLPTFTLHSIWNHYSKEYWKYSSGSHTSCLFNGEFSLKNILVAIGVYIRIMGVQKDGVSRKEKHPQRMSVKLALNHAKTTFPTLNCESYNNIETIISRYYIPYSYFESISANFCSIINHPGEMIAGDEKLLSFTGDSAFLRYVPNKPDQLGLWHYELACKTESGFYYMMHVKFSDSSKALNKAIPVSDIVKSWADTASSFTPSPILVFDSYYLH